MKLIALVTLVTAKGNIPPGETTDVIDKDEAESLVVRGFAAKPVEVAKPTMEKADKAAKAKADAEAKAAEAAAAEAAAAEAAAAEAAAAEAAAAAAAAQAAANAEKPAV